MSKANKTITQLRAELDELLAWFESDKFVLEEAIGKFEAAEKIARQIETELKQYKNQITVLKKRFDEGGE